MQYVTAHNAGSCALKLSVTWSANNIAILPQLLPGLCILDSEELLSSRAAQNVNTGRVHPASQIYLYYQPKLHPKILNPAKFELPSLVSL